MKGQEVMNKIKELEELMVDTRKLYDYFKNDEKEGKRIVDAVGINRPMLHLLSALESHVWSSKKRFETALEEVDVNIN